MRELASNIKKFVKIGVDWWIDGLWLNRHV